MFHPRSRSASMRLRWLCAARSPPWIDLPRYWRFPVSGLRPGVDADQPGARSAADDLASLACHSASKNKESGTRVAHAAATLGWFYWGFREGKTDRGSGHSHVPSPLHLRARHLLILCHRLLDGLIVWTGLLDGQLQRLGELVGQK
jgi:hypothetical protein